MSSSQSHRRDEFQLSIPWRVALQQSSPLLPQLGLMLQPTILFVQCTTENGNRGLSSLSHPKGSPQSPHVTPEQQ